MPPFLVILVMMLAAIYALAILLRVACYFRGVEIPALGRALFTAFITTILSLTVAVAVQFALVGDEFNPYAQAAAGALALIAHFLMTTGLYVPLLETRYAKAFSVWLAQAVTFTAIALMLGCCFGVPTMIFGM